MKNIFNILIVILLFIFCFVLSPKPLEIEAKKPVDIQEAEEDDVDFEENKEVNKSKVSKKIYKNEKKKEKNFPKVVKVSYPPYLKKGKITLYLNNPTKYDYPSNQTRADACRILVNKINSAQKSIDFGIYGFEGQGEILNSIQNAKNRGILVRGVADSDENNAPKYKDTEKIRKYANVTYDGAKSLMHNKFFIIDDNFLITGSMNISNTGCGGYNSNSVVVIEDNEIISAYKNEFNQMFEGKFKRKKTDFSTPLIKSDDETSIQVSFSPVGNSYIKVVQPEIKKAKKKIRVSAFILTYNKLIEDLIEAKERGVEVEILLDAVNAKKNKKQLYLMKEKGIKIKTENWGGKNHEKTISIDEDTLILGSTNFTYSGYNVNDENLLLIKNKDLTKFYNGFFDILFNSINNIYLDKFPKAEGFESGNSCFDKIDNDFDGKVDNDDYGCKK